MPNEYPDWWRADIVFLADQLRSQHANLYHTVEKAAFDAAVSDLLKRMPGLPRERVIAGIAHLVAMINDGHTSLWVNSNSSLGFHCYPIRFYEFTDGVVVSEALPDHRHLLGARLLKVGDHSVEEALQRFQPIVSGDNDGMRRHKACAALNIPEWLQALDLHVDAAQPVYMLERPSGETLTLTLPPAVPEWPGAWVNLNENETPLALWQQQPDRFYWFTFIERHQAVYLNHRVVRDAPEEPLSVFFTRLFGFIESHPVTRLIIDLRQNGGGNNALNRALIHKLICCDQVNQPGRLFTLIGRHTFSAAMNLAVDLEQHTHTLFVGEPTGASPNHYGEIAGITLPNSGLELTLSKWYWQGSHQNDKRPHIAPSLPVGLSSHQYRDNVDPVLEAALTYPDKPSP